MVELGVSCVNLGHVLIEKGGRASLDSGCYSLMFVSRRHEKRADQMLFDVTHSEINVSGFLCQVP